MALDIFPQELLWPNSLRWFPSRVTDSGGMTEGGLERLVMKDGGGKWGCEYAAPLLSVETIKLSRALISRMRGGSVPILVPFYNEAEAPYPLGALTVGVPFSDGSIFSDGSMFFGGSISVTASAASLRATTLAIMIVVSGELVGGEVFSIPHPTRGEHLYLVEAVNNDGTIDIWPPLREAIVNDTVLNFDTPKCKMIITNPSDAMGAVTPPYLSSLSLTFREAW